MWSQNAERDAVPIASDGERQMPDARGKSPGAPRQNTNALKHGRYRAESIALRRKVAALLRSMRGLIKECDGRK